MNFSRLIGALSHSKTFHEKTSLQTQIPATGRPIDRLANDLYGLTEEETRIVEKGTTNPKSSVRETP